MIYRSLGLIFQCFSLKNLRLKISLLGMGTPLGSSHSDPYRISYRCAVPLRHFMLALSATADFGSGACPDDYRDIKTKEQ